MNSVDPTLIQVNESTNSSHYMRFKRNQTLVSSPRFNQQEPVLNMMVQSLESNLQMQGLNEAYDSYQKSGFGSARKFNPTQLVYHGDRA